MKLSDNILGMYIEYDVEHNNIDPEVNPFQDG